MQFSIARGFRSEAPVDWLVLPVWEEGLSGLAAELDTLLGGKLTRLRVAGDWTGKVGELVPLLDVAAPIAPRVLLTGLGKQAVATRPGLTRAAVAAGKLLSQKQLGRIAVAPPLPTAALPTSDLILAWGAGLIQGCHGPGLRKAVPGRFEFDHLLLIFPENALGLAEVAAVRRAFSVGRGVNLARDLVNEPPCDLYPETFAVKAAEVCEPAGIECTILDQRQIEKERMGCLLGVARGSARPPRVVVLRYQRGASGQTLGLVGKGVTFDSGGLSLKTNEQMLDMKSDMAGAATVLAAMKAIADLQLPVNLLGVLALVENLPSGTALKLGDVLQARNGKTVEVLNTDAEGRLILADALSYAVDQQVSHLVDLATLTGACMVALGTEIAGLMTNSQSWGDRVLAAIGQAGERAWQLPMDADFLDLLKSHVADLKNVGSRYGGAIIAAKFLEEFVGKTPWVHLDIAGPSWVMDDAPGRDAGGTGCLVRSLVELAGSFEQASESSS